MQEVFEKIIMQVGIRAEKSEIKEMDAKYFEDAQMHKGERIAFGDAIEIVKQAAAEYNNGWIWCSERMPEQHNRVLVCTNNGDYYISHLNKDQNWICTADSTMLRSQSIIAWQPLPAPYQPTRKNCSNRHENGNCLAVGGFCTAVDDEYCKYQPNEEHPKKTNFDKCCESMEAMAQIIDIAKIGWTKEQIMDWLQSEVEE